MEPRNLAAAIPTQVRSLCAELLSHGHQAWVVGGSIRDLLLHADTTSRDAADWDIATSAQPAEVQRVFRRVIPTGIEHGTVTVMVGKTGYEVTTLRAEGDYIDGRRPTSVEFVRDIAADLARRDFTVNAIAYDPVLDTLIDPFGGMEDLKRRILRAVRDPLERFSEDGLRVLRGIRFAATLGFELEEQTLAAIQPSLASYKKVSAERIRQEWLKTFKAEKPSVAFELMKDHGLLAITLPELLEAVGCEQNRYHAFDVWGHTMSCLDHAPPSAVLRMSALLHDVGKPRSREFSEKTSDYTFYNHELIGADMSRPILERLKFSNEERDRVVALVRHHLICYDEQWTDAAVRRWLRRVGPELVEDLYLLGKADALGKGTTEQTSLQRIDALKEHVRRVIEAGAALSTRDLALNGRDLMQELGLQPGRVIGDILRVLLDEVTEEPERNQRDILLGRARELAVVKGSPS